MLEKRKIPIGPFLTLSEMGQSFFSRLARPTGSEDRASRNDIQRGKIGPQGVLAIVQPTGHGGNFTVVLIYCLKSLLHRIPLSG